MKFRQSKFGFMFFLPSPSKDGRSKEQKDQHWSEVLAWCEEQFGPRCVHHHPRDFNGWDCFRPMKHDQLPGVYFSDADAAFSFKMRWC